MKAGAKEHGKDLDEIKKVIRSLLLSTKNGLTVNELCSDYTVITSKVLPYKELGYFSAIELIKDMPDVIRPTFLSGGVMVLRGIADEYTSHISALVHGQKSVDVNSKLCAPQQVLKKPTKKVISSFIQSKIFAVIKHHQSGLDISSFENAYLQEYGKRLNPLLQGFVSTKSLLESCSDIVKLHVSKGDVTIYPVKAEKMKENAIKSRCNISKEMKKEIFSVLVRHNNGIDASHFPSEFKNHCKKELDFQNLGFNSLIELMSKLSDMVTIERVCTDSDWLLIPKVYIIDSNGAIVRKHCYYTTCPPGDINEQVEICLSYIINPSLFWFQQIKNLSCLCKLQEEMNSFYSCVEILDYTLPIESLVVGQLCVARYDDDQWYRAIIKSVSSSCDKADVFFVDYGDNLHSDASSLCILQADFLQLPCQAVAARLHGVAQRTWSKDVIKSFFDLTHDQKLLATIVDENTVMSVDIRTTDDCRISRLLQQQCGPLVGESHEETLLEEVPVAGENSFQLQSDECNKIECEVKADIGFVLVKCLSICEDYTLHIICDGDVPCILSSELSRLFWDGDVVKQMLRRKNIQIKCKVLIYKEKRELFSTLVKYNVSGVFNDGVVRPCVTAYALPSILEIFSYFVCKYENALALLEKEVTSWNTAATHYWRKGTSSPGIPQEDLLLKLQDLKGKRKELYQEIMMNVASSTALHVIKTIDEEISHIETNMKNTM